MRSTFGGLEIGKRAMNTSQNALNVTFHNIANEKTPGYTRQRAELIATRPYAAPAMGDGRYPAQMGTGVEIEQIARLRDQFSDRQFRNENKYLGYYESRIDTYGKIETIFQDIRDEDGKGTGLQAAMDKLWGAWQDLVGDAEKSEVREQVLGYAKGLTDVFSHISQSMLEYQADLNHVVEVRINEVNSIATRIQDLNAQIARIVPHGYTANDLNDQRDVLIDQLSKLVDVEVLPRENGMVDILIGGGQPLVTGLEMTPLVSTPDANGFHQIAGFSATSGSLLEALEARGIPGQDGNLVGIIPDVMNTINTLASVLAREVNDLHRAGQNLIDLQNPGDPPSSLPFFVSRQAYEALPPEDRTNPAVLATLPDPTEMDDLMVNPLIVDNPDYLAAAGSNGNGPADGETAQEIANLKKKLITNGFTNATTLDGFYASFIGELGIDAQRAENLLDVKRNLVNHVENRRLSVAGVNVDEEIVEMIKFQKAYNASARTITAMDEMLDRIINGMGIVGR